MSVPATTAEFDAYVHTVARTSRLTGILSAVGLVVVLGALVLSAQQLASSRRELAAINQQVTTGQNELQEMQKELVAKRAELRSATDSLARVREGFATYQLVVRQQSPAVAVTAAEVARDSAAAARVVYIQFRGTISRPLVNGLRAELNGAGYNAPGVERIDRVFRTSVKYFHPQDATLADELARRTQEYFRRQGCPVELPTQDASGLRLKVPVGQVEVWVDLNCPGSPGAR